MKLRLPTGTLSLADCRRHLAAYNQGRYKGRPNTEVDQAGYDAFRDGLSPAVIPSEDLKAVGVTAQQMKVARMLVETMAAKWKPEQYKDEYSRQLMKWIAKKIESGQAHKALEDAPPEEDVPPTYNFLDLLKRSVDAAGESGKRKGMGGSALGRKRPSTRSAPVAKVHRRRKAG